MFAEPPVATAFRAPPVVPKAGWRGRDPLIGMGILVAGFVLISTLLVAFVTALDLKGDGQDFAAAIFTIAFEVFFGLSVLMLARRRHINLAQLGFRRPDRWAPVGIAVAGSYSVLLGYGIAIQALHELGVDTGIFEGGNSIPIDEGSDTLPLVGLLVIFGVAVVAVAPLAEEIFFRGLLFRALDGVWPSWAAIAVSGLAFGAFHVNLAVLLPFTIIGMLFAWAFKASGSLWVSITAHFIINTVSLIVTVIGVLN
ncbi:MAG: CPBP family intramembrane metalloprotease [Chloroflexi bacterium]|nr:CPBP family intramembrane metalloprotease [Chloroflexota bacterium]MDA1146421.1 CPBP family intramembrane metalloprotease [Chloroflexota bacterium]MQC82292.1 CPBP family intramembrane metalloprotease [Chloroflexota bacterium]MQC82649.1 CPBP family intramembrane metalloprotease [Chloroflexota bacterium]PKB56716.1 MAG: hypothetical protein BZY69_00250 [SAR202 cluster bacterium Casp-Chloro-G1]